MPMTPEEFAAARDRLQKELVLVHDIWEQYQTFFAHSAERIDMLNSLAGWFFGSLQRVFLQETILGISRVTDPFTTYGHQNLVMATLLQDPALDQLPEFRERLGVAIAAATDAAGPIRIHRNKYIAHLDHATAVGELDEPLPGLKRSAITACITALEGAYNLHNGRLHNTESRFDISSLNSAPAIVRLLESSERWRKLRELRAKDPPPQGGAV